MLGFLFFVCQFFSRVVVVERGGQAERGCSSNSSSSSLSEAVPSYVTCHHCEGIVEPRYLCFRTVEELSVGAKGNERMVPLLGNISACRERGFV